MPKVPQSPRAAKHQLERIKDLLSHLNIARSFQEELGLDTTGIDLEIELTRSHQRRLHAVAGRRIESRGRFKKVARLTQDDTPQYFLFLDECGSHVIGHVDSGFPVFCLAGVIVNKSDYDRFDVTWKAWKNEHLGSADIVSHEPDVRSNSRGFRRESPNERAELLTDLDNILNKLEFTCISAVVDLEEFRRLHSTSMVDEFLPSSCYLMAIDFVMERFVHFLQNAGGDAKGLVIAESRGAREDAIVHAEFINLHLRGTQFISESDFRYQLRPYIEFYRKARNNSGLQIADLAARPFAEIVRDPQSEPERWKVFKRKLYDGSKNAPHSYGLKVFPLTSMNDPFPDYPRKTKGDT